MCLSHACAGRLTWLLTHYLYVQFAVIAHTARLTDTRRFQTLLDAPGNSPILASASCRLPVLLCGVERARGGARVPPAVLVVQENCPSANRYQAGTSQTRLPTRNLGLTVHMRCFTQQPPAISVRCARLVCPTRGPSASWESPRVAPATTDGRTLWVAPTSSAPSSSANRVRQSSLYLQVHAIRCEGAGYAGGGKGRAGMQSRDVLAGIRGYVRLVTDLSAGARLRRKRRGLRKPHWSMGGCRRMIEACNLDLCISNCGGRQQVSPLAQVCGLRVALRFIKARFAYACGVSAPACAAHKDRELVIFHRKRVAAACGRAGTGRHYRAAAVPCRATHCSWTARGTGWCRPFSSSSPPPSVAPPFPFDALVLLDFAAPDSGRHCR